MVGKGRALHRNFLDTLVVNFVKCRGGGSVGTGIFRFLNNCLLLSKSP